MSLFDLLDNYKTTPSREIRKIQTILKRNKSISLTRIISFEKALDYVFKISDFGSYELDIDSFITKIALEDYDYNNEEGNILQYRRLCEFLLNLLDEDIYYDHKQLFKEDEKQLWSLICNGLKSCGYTQVYDSNDKRVTKKIDVVAESVAALNNGYKDDIFDYLISKVVSEKENALTSLSIKLEAVQRKDAYTGKIREYVQLLRHKEEKKKENKYSWFFDENNYETHLDKLFKLFLSSIMHDCCNPILEEFKKNCGEV